MKGAKPLLQPLFGAHATDSVAMQE